MCTEIQSFSFSLDTKESEKPASAVADVRRHKRFLEKEVWCVANSWEGACSTSGCWSSAYTWASTEGWRGRHVILFAPTLPLVSHLRVWQYREWSFWTDIEIILILVDISHGFEKYIQHLIHGKDAYLTNQNNSFLKEKALDTLRVSAQSFWTFHLKNYLKLKHSDDWFQYHFTPLFSF